MIHLKRLYSEAERGDGSRYLVDRLWPRGIKKQELRLDGWLKEVGPSDDLRRWFGHDPQKWPEFQQSYKHELDKKPESWQPLLEAARHGDITLLYSARDTAHNNAVVLKEYLTEKLNP